MKIDLLFFFSIFLLADLVMVSVAAANQLPSDGTRYRRHVEFEWEAVPGALTYDLEIQKSGKILKFTTGLSRWEGSLVPGLYKMRIRAKDQRGVPADWSPPEDFKVSLEPATLTAPKNEEQILSQEIEQTKIKFVWLPVPAAENYLFQISSEDGSFKRIETVRDPDLELRLPVAKKYKWNVIANGLSLQSDSVTDATFSLLGANILSPNLEKPETEFVRELKWKPAPNAASYDCSLQKWNAKAKVWEQVEKKENLTDTFWNFSPDHPGGRYRFLVQAKADLRGPSSITHVDFKAKSGDRSPAAEEITTLRMSIDRLIGWYGIASYLITMVDYKGVNFDRSNSAISYSAIGGTGRLGAGYLSPKSAWGFLGVTDLGGITVANSSNYTYASAEANAIYRMHWGARGEFRQQVGVFYKELPETIGKTSDSITAMNLIKTLGPHYGAEYWFAVNSKWGFQVNAHLYPSLIKVKTPNGQDIQASFSNQLGVLGSYRLDRNLTGLAGYAFRQDQISYRAESGKGSAGANDFNQVQLSGHYLNLFLEWAI